MAEILTACPKCGAAADAVPEKLAICFVCGHSWTCPSSPPPPPVIKAQPVHRPRSSCAPRPGCVPEHLQPTPPVVVKGAIPRIKQVPPWLTSRSRRSIFVLALGSSLAMSICWVIGGLLVDLTTEPDVDARTSVRKWLTQNVHDPHVEELRWWPAVAQLTWFDRPDPESPEHVEYAKRFDRGVYQRLLGRDVQEWDFLASRTAIRLRFRSRNRLNAYGITDAVFYLWKASGTVDQVVTSDDWEGVPWSVEAFSAERATKDVVLEFFRD